MYIKIGWSYIIDQKSYIIHTFAKIGIGVIGIAVLGYWGSRLLRDVGHASNKASNWVLVVLLFVDRGSITADRKAGYN